MLFRRTSFWWDNISGYATSYNLLGFMTVYSAWISECFSLWAALPNCRYWNLQWASLNARCIKHSRSSFDWEPFLPTLFTNFVRSFEVIHIQRRYSWWHQYCVSLLTWHLWWYMHRSADASVRLFDHRKISASGQGVPIEQFEGHSAAVLCVQVYSIASAVIKLFHLYKFINTCAHS